MTDNTMAIVMVCVGLFLIGGVISLYRQGTKVGAVICGVASAMALTAGVLWW